jgi:hypothetical protein
MNDAMQLNIYKKTEESKESSKKQIDNQVKKEALAVTSLKREMCMQKE